MLHLMEENTLNQFLEQVKIISFLLFALKRTNNIMYIGISNTH